MPVRLQSIFRHWCSWGLKRVRRAGSARLGVTRLEDRTVPAFGGGVSVAAGDWNSDGFADIATGAGPGGGPHVKVFSGATGEEIVGLFAFDPAFAGGVSVALGDVTEDGRLDLVVGAGASGGPHVRVFDGTTLAEVFSVMAFEADFRGGVSVTAADIDGDGRAEVIAGAGAGGGPHVRAFSVATGAVVWEFMAFAPDLRGGVRVASGDVTGDGVADIIAGSGSGGPPLVRAFDGFTRSLAFEATAFEPQFVGGTHVAVGDVTGDGVGEVIVGAASGGGPRVRILDRAGAEVGGAVGNFWAYAPGFSGGVYLAAFDLDGDGIQDVITGAGPGGGPHVRAFRSSDSAGLASFMAYDPVTLGGPFARRRSAGANTPPMIGEIPDLTISVDDRVGVVPLSVADAESSADTLIVTARSENEELVAQSGLVVSGTGANRSLSITPAVGRVGSTALVVTVQDQQGLRTSRRLTLTVTPGVVPPTDNTAPTITGVRDVRTPLEQAVSSLTFTVADRESPSDVLTVSAVSENPTFIPASGLTLSGTGETRTLTVTPTVGATGSGGVTVTVRDPQGLSTTARFAYTVTGKSPPPPPGGNTAPTISGPADQRLDLGNPSDGLSLTVQDAESAPESLVVTAATSNPTLLPLSGIILSGSGSARSLVVVPAVGQVGSGAVTLTVRDPEGLTTSTTFTVSVTEPTVSDPGVSTADFRAATEFLYTGPGAVQTGVAPGTIDALRAAVVRGRVLGLDGQPLADVTVTVLDASQYGQTVTRADGYYDLAVNGGGSLVIEYAKAGYLPIQRRTDTPWRDFAVVDDVALTPLDSAVTAIDLTSTTDPIQVARGNVVTDEDGMRQATLFFPQGTTATMTLPNGEVQPLTSLNVRATEYTVGETGPMAMPGTLPPTSGYTYAVELSVDEAMAAGATEVTFSQPVPFYVENFLNFPVGMAVPAGYYDRERGVWVPSDNGRVIQVLSVAGGVASVDGDGDGDADTVTELVALGVTNAELVQLASTYQAGANLWRVPVPHFTPWDFNWPFGPPDDAVPPTINPNEVNDKPLTEQSPECGSLIRVEGQSLSESVAISGSALTLQYISSRAEAAKSRYALSIPLTKEAVPSGVKRVELTISVAGRDFNSQFAPSPNLRAEFLWDGLDAYGDSVAGGVIATVSIRYVYDGIYMVPLNARQAFAAFTGVPITGDVQSREVTLTQSFNRDFQSPLSSSSAMAGWAISTHHKYDPVSGIVHLGDGDELTASSGVISTVLGTGVNAFSSPVDTSLPAVQMPISLPIAVKAAPDGSIFVADRYFVRRVGSDGQVSVVAGGEYSRATRILQFADGQPATATQFNIRNIDIDSLGNLYIVTSDYFDVTGFGGRVIRVDSSGTIRTVAGGGSLESRFGTDHNGRPAIDIYFPLPRAIAADGLGGFYLSDSSSIHHVRADGLFYTVARGGFNFLAPSSMELDSDGSLYIADARYHRVYRLTPDGVLVTLAGSIYVNAVEGEGLFSGDGGPATAATLNSPYGLAIGSDGAVYIADGANQRIRKVDPSGVITTVAGIGPTLPNGSPLGSYLGDGGSASAAGLSWMGGIDFGPDGEMYVADRVNFRVRKIDGVLPSFRTDGYTVSSKDGSEVYQFNSTGRHLQTLDALTGTPIFTFGYDSAGRLATVTDADGDITRIERTAAGTPYAIVAPDGQRTTFGLNADGYLSRITNPAGESHTFAYAEGGLLTRFTDPLGNSSRFTYDDLGRLIRNEDAAGGFTELRREELGRGNYKVTTTNAVGRVQQYLVEYQPDGSLKRTTIDARGFRTVTTIGTDGTRTTTSPDGTVATTKYGPDPRFGMQSPVITEQTIRTPSGLASTMTGSQMATFATPSDPTSALVTLTDAVTINGKTFTTLYTAATRTYTTTSAEGRTTSTVTDEKGRVVRATVPGVTPTTYDYDSRGRLESVSQGNRTVRYAYNGQGYLASITDPLNRTTRLDYDAEGRITRQVQPDGSEIRFRYDREGKMVGLTPPGQPEHTFEYNSRDLVTETDPPFAFAGDDTTNYTYNLARQLTREVLPNGTVIDYAYCACGRPTDITTPWGNYAYTYSSTTGQLTNVTGPGGFALNTGYDGILVTSEEMTGPVAGRVNWTYDQNFRVTSESVNGGNTVTFAYDGDDLLTRSGDLTLARDAQNGRVTGSTLGTVTDTVSYDTFGDRSGYRATVGAAVGLEYTFTRDQLGRITRKVETTNGVTTTTDYGYDQKCQLTTVTVNGVVQQTYAYDPNGNRLSLTTPSGTETGVYDAQDRLLSYGTKAYTYWADGSLRSVTDSATGQTTAYTYDGFGNLTRVDLPDGRVIEYLIDPDNRRVGKKLNGVLSFGLVYNGQLTPAAMVDASGTVVARFVYATGVNVPEYMVKGGVTYRLITDHLGSVRMVVNAATGEVVQRLEYDAFGRVTQDTNPGFQPFGYAGGLYDAETGLVRFGARDYSGLAGRWLTKDGVGYYAGQPLYTYSSNDPVNLLDITGFDPVNSGGLDSIRNTLDGKGKIDSSIDLKNRIEILNDLRKGRRSLGEPPNPNGVFSDGLIDPALDGAEGFVRRYQDYVNRMQKELDGIRKSSQRSDLDKLQDDIDAILRDIDRLKPADRDNFYKDFDNGCYSDILDRIRNL